MSGTPARYHAIAIALHWVMAIAFLLMLASGIIMTSDMLEKSDRFTLYQWHKSLGVLLLISFVLRLTVRLLAKPPTLPASMKPAEKKMAIAGHWALYVWMLLVPLSGWLLVSSSAFGLPTVVFGWFTWPHIPNISGNHDIHEFAEASHGLLAYMFLTLIAVHIAAVVKHYVIDKENLLPRMGIGRNKKD